MAGQKPADSPAAALDAGDPEDLFVALISTYGSMIYVRGMKSIR